MNPTSYTNEGVLSGLRVHWHDAERLRATRGYSILESAAGGDSFAVVCRVPTSWVRRALARIEPLRTLLRVGIRTYLQIDRGRALVFADRKIYLCGKEQVRLVGHMRAGRAPFPQGCCSDSQGRIYFGEYWKNPQREEVRVYRTTGADFRWEPIIVFPAGAVRHIHAVQFDPFSKLVWIATGDDDKECRIGYIDPESASPQFHSVFEGTQMARAVSLLFTQTHVYWGSDSTFTENWILRRPRAGGTVERVAKIGAPAYFSTQNIDGHMFISTCVEGSTPEQDRFARIWMSVDGERWEVLDRFEKDRFPYTVSYGRISFSQGISPDGRIYAFAEGLKGRSGSRIYAPDAQAGFETTRAIGAA